MFDGDMHQNVARLLKKIIRAQKIFFVFQFYRFEVIKHDDRVRSYDLATPKPDLAAERCPGSAILPNGAP